MARLLVFTLVSLLCIATLCAAQTYISGSFTDDQTWTAAGSPYILVGHTYFSGASLTIETGVEVQLSDFNLRLAHSGTGSLNAQDTEFVGPGQLSFGFDGDGLMHTCQYSDLELTGYGSPTFAFCTLTAINLDLLETWTFYNTTFQACDIDVFESTVFTGCTFSDAEHALDLRAGHADFTNCQAVQLDHPFELAPEATFTTAGTNWTTCDRDTIWVEGAMNDDWTWPPNPPGIMYQIGSGIQVTAATLTMDHVTLHGRNSNLTVASAGGRILMTDSDIELIRMTGSYDSQIIMANSTINNLHFTLYEEFVALGTTFSGTVDFYFLDGSHPFLKDCNLIEETSFHCWDDDLIHAEECWWDGVNGPTHPDNPPGNGIPVPDGVNFSNWRTTPYDPANDLVLFAIVPETPAITIPGTGGSFLYDAYLFSNAAGPANGDFWIRAVLPNGTLYSVSQRAITVPPRVLIIAPNQDQAVPAVAPAGDYIYRAHVGVYPNYVVDDEEFGFTVEP